MPDKDFDKLFKDSFMDAEIEPSANLWGNIAEQLEPKKKRSLPILWVAAASVAMVASALLFTQGGDKVYLQGAVGEVASVVIPKTENLPVVATEEETVVSSVILPEHTTTSSSFLKRAVAKEVVKPIEDTQKNNFIAMQPSENNERPEVKRAEVKPLDITPQETIADGNNQARMIAQVDNTKKAELDIDAVDETGDNKNGIRNVGDLINYVVGKVDKREKKLIKFDTDDDDNSTIIGLNIGFLKLNKKNK